MVITSDWQVADTEGVRICKEDYQALYLYMMATCSAGEGVVERSCSTAKTSDSSARQEATRPWPIEVRKVRRQMVAINQSIRFLIAA